MDFEEWLVSALRDGSPLLLLMVVLGVSERLVLTRQARAYLPWLHALAFVMAGYLARVEQTRGELVLTNAYAVLVGCAVMLLPWRQALAVVAALMALLAHASWGASTPKVLNLVLPPLLSGVAALSVVALSQRMRLAWPAWTPLLLAAFIGATTNFLWAWWAPAAWTVELQPLSWDMHEVSGPTTHAFALFLGTFVSFFALGLLRTATVEWEEQSRQLRRFKQSADGLLAVLPDNLLVLDEHQKVVEVMAYGQPFWPYLKVDAIRGKSLADIVPERFVEQARVGVAQALSEGAAAPLLTTQWTLEGRLKHLEWRFFQQTTKRVFVLVRDVSDNQALRTQLSRQNAEMQALQGVISDLAGVWSPAKGTRWLANAALFHAPGAPQEAPGLLDLVVGDDRATVQKALADVLEVPGHSRTLEVGVQAQSGVTLRYEVLLRHTTCLDDAECDAVLFLGQDITERAARQVRESWSNELLANIPQALVVLDSDSRQIKWANNAFFRLSGYGPQDAMGHVLDELLHSAPGGAPMPGLLELSLRPHWRGCFSSRRSDGTWFQEQRQVRLFEDSQGSSHLLVCLQDAPVQEQRASALSTPAEFVAKARQLISAHKGEPVSVGILGVAHWEAVYRQKGQAAFDAFAAEAKSRLLKHCEPVQLAAQIAADRIALLFVGREISVYAQQLAQVVSATHNPPWFGKASLRVGLASKSEVFESPEQLLDKATFAFEQACSSASSSVICHRREMSHVQDARGGARRRALDALHQQNDLELHFEPIYWLHRNGLAGAAVAPKWIGDFEDSVLKRLAHQTLDSTEDADNFSCLQLSTLCRYVQVWTSHGLKPMRFTLQLRPTQVLRPEFVARYTQTAREFQVFPGLFSVELDFEDCRTLGEEDATALSEGVRRLRAKGFAVTLGSVGLGQGINEVLSACAWTGFSLDRRLVQGLGVDPILTGVCETLLRRALLGNMSVTAQGVQTAQQLDTLRANGCSSAKGPYFGKVVDRAGMAALMLEPDTARLSNLEPA